MSFNKIVQRVAGVSGRVIARITVASAIAVALPSVASASSLLPNGSFTLGQTGFGSGYEFNEDCWGEGTYLLAGSANACHPLWADFGDHTTGDGVMMVVNGSLTDGMEVWFAEVAVTPNTDYVFSGWLATLYARSPASLELMINGSSAAISLDAPDAVGRWQPISSTWNSGSSTVARLVLLDRNLDEAGNDFALDDLSFSSPVANMIENPEPLSLTLLGSGLVVLAMLRRRRSIS